MSLSDVAIPRKLALAFAALIATFSIVSAVVFVNVIALHHVAEARDDAKRASDHADDMLAGVIEGQSAVRGYVLLGARTFIDTWEESRQSITDSANNFSRYADRADQKERIARFTAAVTDWENNKVATTLRLYDDPATREQARELAGAKQLGDMRKIHKEIQDAQAAWIGAQDAEQAHAEWMVKLVLAIGGGVAVALSALLGWLLSRSIARPVVTIADVMGEMAQGRNDVDVPGTQRRDEIGRIARSVLVFREAAIDKARAEQEQQQVMKEVGAGLTRLADADLNTRLAGFPPSYAKLERDFNSAMEAMTEVMGAVSSATNGINDGASDIRAASDDLSQRTEQQAASLEETAAAMHEITTTVRETATGAARASSVVAETRSEAEESGKVVVRAVEAMSGIERSSSEISEIITVIDGIAFQTNLLALNAGVEAARAGDAGKGFAVVASEVRALAQRSADAAKDVKAKIVASGHQVEAGVQLVSETGKALNRIIGRIGEISELVSHIADSAEQQATGLQQVNTAVSEMDGVTQQNAAMVQEATAAARSLAVEADELARQVSRFRIGTTGGGAPAPAAAPASARAAAPARAVPAVHRLQERAAQAGRSIARQSRGSAAAVVATDDWSEF